MVKGRESPYIDRNRRMWVCDMTGKILSFLFVQMWQRTAEAGTKPSTDHNTTVYIQEKPAFAFMDCPRSTPKRPPSDQKQAASILSLTIFPNTYPPSWHPWLATPPHHMKNSQDFVKKVCHCKLQPEETMVSYNIISLSHASLPSAWTPLISNVERASTCRNMVVPCVHQKPPVQLHTKIWP